MEVNRGKYAGRDFQVQQTISAGTRQGHCVWLRPGVPTEGMWRQRDLVVARANRHPHPAVTCLVRNLDCDQRMRGSTTVLSLWRTRRVWQEQAPGGGVKREGLTGVCGDSEHRAVDTESNVRTGSMCLLNGVCDVRACLPLVVTGGLTVGALCNC